MALGTAAPASAPSLPALGLPLRQHGADDRRDADHGEHADDAAPAPPFFAAGGGGGYAWPLPVGAAPTTGCGRVDGAAMPGEDG